MRLSSSRIGEISGITSMLLWSLFPVLINQNLNPLSPVFNAAASTLLAVLPAALMLSVRVRWRELLEREAWKPLILGSLMIGVLFYGLLFVAGQHTTPGNVALLGLFEIVTSYFLLRNIEGEQNPFIHHAGAALMLLGAVILLMPGELEMNLGDMLVLAACLVPPYGNLFMKKARALVSSETILLVRSALGGIILLGISAAFEGTPETGDLREGGIYVVLNGLFLMGFSKILWTECIYRLTIPKAVSFMALMPACTLVLAYFILGTLPTPM